MGTGGVDLALVRKAQRALREVQADTEGKEMLDEREKGETVRAMGTL